MKISVKIKPNSKESKVERKGENIFLVYVKSPPIENKANQELVEIISDYFNIPKSKVLILSGLHTKNKIIEIKE